MPSSRPNPIPTVIHLVRQLKPRSILDVGVGFGKWGHLFREYTDILEAEHDPARYRRENWQVRIDGIEGHPDYLTEMHRFIYNEIFVGDARTLLRAADRYDLIFMGDILEHLEKNDGRQLLQDAREKANQAVILTTPKYETDQTDLCGNELERHRSLWSARDFRKFAGAVVKTIDRATLIVILPSPGTPILKVSPPVQPGATVTRRLHLTRAKLITNVPRDAPFILVDDEQLRHELPHQHALPFLEKLGQYYGPPGDDETAIQELERMRSEGASMIAIVWSSFWWLERYRAFHRHLRDRYPCVHEDDHLIVFKLQMR
jgi:hypothetical protein